MKRISSVKRWLSLGYKVLLLLSAVTGILLQCAVGTSRFSLSSFRMFTTLSNLAVAVFYSAYVAAELWKPGSSENSVIFRYLKFLITMSILLTGLVAHFMLRGMFDGMDPIAKAGLTLLHIVVPIGTFLDWLLFDAKGRTTWKMPLFAALFPLTYVSVSMIAAQFLEGPMKYPYPFLNADTLGAGAVVRNILLLAAAFLAVGYVGVLLDHTLKKARLHGRTMRRNAAKADRRTILWPRFLSMRCSNHDTTIPESRPGSSGRDMADRKFTGT